uniref:Uncharacterized protein n=1 Tax=Lepeophtheirus salmonis TaxID=72036 RepID=A0A0K2V2F2_LEPSM
MRSATICCNKEEKEIKKDKGNNYYNVDPRFYSKSNKDLQV